MATQKAKSCRHCHQPVHCRQMCQLHYDRMRRRGTPHEVFTVQPYSHMQNTRRAERLPCRECDRPPVARGLCDTHYHRWWRMQA